MRLGETRKRLRKAIGPPKRTKHGVDRWCVVGGAKLRVAYSKRNRATLAITNARGQSLKGVSPGARAAKAKHALRGAHRVRLGHRMKALIVREGHHRAGLVAIRPHRVAWVGVAKRHGIVPALRRTLRH